LTLELLATLAQPPSSLALSGHHYGNSSYRTRYTCHCHQHRPLSPTSTGNKNLEHLQRVAEFVLVSILTTALMFYVLSVFINRLDLSGADGAAF